MDGPGPSIFIAGSAPAGMRRSCSRCEKLNETSMAKWKQYELWVQTAESKWEIVGIFPNTELATAVANARASRARLIEVFYDGSKMLGQEIIAEIGNTRKE